MSYPEKDLHNYGELERHLLLLRNGETMSYYTNLPNLYTAMALEAYGNWFAEETTADPLHYERGSIVFYDRRKSGIVFPRNPQVGDHQITFSIPHHPDCEILTSSHSHSDESPFSSDADLIYFLVKHDNHSLFKYCPVMQVASRRYNYLLVRAADTVPLATEPLFWDLRYLDGFEVDEDIQAIKKHFSYKNQYGTGLPEKVFDRLHWRSGIDLIHPSSLDSFYHAFFFEMLVNYFLSRKHHYGFYYSKKDGLYRKIGPTEVVSILGEAIDERFVQTAEITP